MRKHPLPAIVSNIAPDLRRCIDRIREVLDDPEGLVTKKDLVGTGVFSQVTSTGNLEYSPPGAPESCNSPPAPLNLTAVGAMTSVILSWDGVAYNSCYSHTEIYRAATDDLGVAVLIGTTTSGVFADAVGSDSSKYYWVRFVNTLSASGAYNATIGVLGATSPDLEYVLDQLSEAYGTGSDAPFFQINTATTINGVSIPAGTYMKSAFMHDASITNAKIGNLAVDSAKIADASISTAKIALLAVDTAQIASAAITNAKINDLNASKITAGTISADRIGALSITAGKIKVVGTGAVTPGTIGAVAPGDVYSSRLDVAFFVNLDGSLATGESNSFPTGKHSDSTYSAATKGTRNFIGTNTVSWSASAGESAPSSTIADYAISQLEGATGTNFHVQLVSNNGYSFKNNTGAIKTLTANAYVNGVLASTATHSSYVYQWYNGSNIAYVTSSGDYVSTSPAAGLYPADGTDAANGLNLRSIKVDSSDVSFIDTLNLQCVVTDNN